MLCVLIRIASYHYCIEDWKDFPKLLPFASWSVATMADPQWLEHTHVLNKFQWYQRCTSHWGLTELTVYIRAGSSLVTLVCIYPKYWDTLTPNHSCPRMSPYYCLFAGLGGSVGCAVRLETRRSQVQPMPRSATFFRGDWSWNIFYGHSLPSADSRRAVVSFWRKNVHNTG